MIFKFYILFIYLFCTSTPSASQQQATAQLRNVLNIPKMIKKSAPFKINTNTSDYDSDYKENFIKLIENFLLIHLKKIARKENLVEEENFEILTSSTQAVHLHEKFGKCNLSLVNSDGIAKCKAQIEHYALTSTTTPKPVLNLTQMYLKQNNYTYAIYKMKHSLNYYKNYFFYFISIIILLATLCIILMVILFISCVINCKQRAKISFYNENEFFTYYNKNLPIIASVSSFSLTRSKEKTIKPVVEFATSSVKVQDENLKKEHLNFIAGTRKKQESITSVQRSVLNQDNNLATDDDDDLVLENEINKQIIENYDKGFLFSDINDSERTFSSQISTNLPRINITSESFVKEEDMACSQILDSKNNEQKIKMRPSFSEKSKKMGNLFDNEQITSSPNYIRDRYYQILREQVFPFLQRPTSNLMNVNQSAKDIQSYSSDVLY